MMPPMGPSCEKLTPGADASTGVSQIFLTLVDFLPRDHVDRRGRRSSPSTGSACAVTITLERQVSSASRTSHVRASPGASVNSCSTRDERVVLDADAVAAGRERERKSSIWSAVSLRPACRGSRGLSDDGRTRKWRRRWGR